MGQKGFDFGGTHLGRVPDVVEKDIAFDPVDVGLFGADGVMFEADGITHPIEQFFASRFRCFSSDWSKPGSVALAAVTALVRNQEYKQWFQTGTLSFSFSPSC